MADPSRLPHVQPSAWIWFISTKPAIFPNRPIAPAGHPVSCKSTQQPTGPGYSGHVSEASEEKGKKLIQISEEGVVKLIENRLKQEDVPGSSKADGNL